MKTYTSILLLTLLSSHLVRLSLAQPASPPSDATTPATNQPAPEATAPAPAAPTNAAPQISSEYGNDGLRMNFHGAPLNLVLEYLSDAAGFIINKHGDVRGTVEVCSKQP